MATLHPEFEPPAPNDVLWRYMDFTKYVALLESGHLYFPKAENLGDPFEGSISQATIERRRKAFQMFSPEKRGDHTEEEHLLIYKSLFLKARTLTYVSCWHLNDGESVAMWKLYSPSGAGVALKTSYKRLFELTPPEVFIGKVQYKDYESADIPDHNLFSPFVHKQKSFAHENEVRAVIQYDIRSVDPLPAYKSVPVSLEKLVECIFVNPSAPAWYAKLVKDVTARYGLNIPMRQSRLDSAALF